MKEHPRQLTIDEAVSEFRAMVNERFGESLPGDSLPPESPQEAETTRFRMSEYLVKLAWPQPLAYVLTRQSSASSSHPRRTPGSDAVRYAIWVYMSSLRR